MNDNDLSPVKRALLEIKDLQARLNEAQRAKTEPIAIIGAGLRFPGQINDLDSYWQFLRQGRDAITEIPKDRWDIDEFYDLDPEAPGKMYSRKGGFLDHIDQFDAPFFGISPREAIGMDPQQRLLLQVGWESLENAGQAPDKLNGSQTGVFIGIGNNDYTRLLVTDARDIDLHYATGNSFSVAPGRLSYLLGLKGPSIAIDTACSSSLVAIHLACQSLRLGESDLALAGGVNVILSPEMHINFCKAKMMAFDDKCKTFDAAADGYVRGEGCGIVVLKRLTDALGNNDKILAIIKGSAVNQDGRSSGLTAPNGPSQEAVIRSALAHAGVKPAQVDYLETHGTGTSLGDPIEVQALGAVLREGRSKAKPLMIGSVKTNLGHLEAAAGIAGLLKVVLALQHQEVPPHLHLQNLSPYIPWQKLSVIVPTERTPWRKNGAPRMGGVSSFGFSGTNAHIVLQEAPELPASQDHDTLLKKERPIQILTLSAKRPEALNELANRYSTFLSDTQIDFNNFCFTSKAGRAQLPHRVAVISKSIMDAREKLAAFLAGTEVPDVFHGYAANGNQPEVTFLFTGHGAHYINMGRELYETCPSFRADLEECNRLLEPYLEKPLLTVFFPSDDRPGVEMGTMTYTQPALFALQYALARLWMSWGIEPTFVLGHSAGEYTAACIAGVFSLEDGLKLVAARGRLMDSLPLTGKMATVFAEEAQVVAALDGYSDQVSIAAVNGPRHLVISGTSPAIDAVIARFEAGNIRMRQLDISQAAHSPAMDSILDEYESIAAEISFSAPQIGLVSTLTGQLGSDDELTNPGYWRHHLREPVQFAAAMKTLQHEGQRIFVEIGPQPTLLSMGRRCLPELEDTGLWLPSLRKGREDCQEILESLGTLYVNGANINWAEFERPYEGRSIALPTYPWAKDSYWRAPSRSARTVVLSPEAGSAWETILASGRRQEQQAPLDFAMHSYRAKWDTLDRLTVGYILQVLRDLQIFTRANESHSLETIIKQTQILNQYSGLLSRWLKRLATQDFLVQEGDRFTNPEPLPIISLDTLNAEARALLADMSPVMDYVERCGNKMIPILTGKESPLETLFPEGSYTTVDYLYNSWSLIRYFNGILQAIVESLVKQIAVNRKVRILEIGAGTGGSTAALMPILPADRTEYDFTDMSDFFLVRAQEKFKDYAFIKYGILNIEKDTKSQGYGARSYDLIIAANALHATKNLKQTIANARELLAPGGSLLLFESTHYLSWFDITTSLIEGWERFDDGIRDETPLLAATRWQEVLQANGFENVAVFPEDPSLAQLFAHNVIVAQVPEEASDAESWEPGEEHTQPHFRSSKTAAASVNADTALIEQLTVALPDDRQELLIIYVREQVAKILRLAPSYPLGHKDRLMDLGLDSLMAVELRSRLNKGLKPKRTLSATLIFDYPTIEAIAKYLDLELFGIEKADPVSEPAPSGMASMVPGEEKVMALSDEEIEALLLKKFEDE